MEYNADSQKGWAFYRMAYWFTILTMTCYQIGEARGRYV
jgi:hypothetical protein